MSSRLWSESMVLRKELCRRYSTRRLRLRIRSSTYRASLSDSDQEITDSTASRDLSRLVDVGLLKPVGEKRGRYYVAAKPLKALETAVIAARGPKDDSDPFAGADVRGPK